MSAVSYHAQAAYHMQCALYRRWVRGERGPQIPPFDEMTVPFPADRTRIEDEERLNVPDGCEGVRAGRGPCVEEYDFDVDWCDWCQVNEEPPGAGADPYGRTAEDWARHAE